MFTPLSKIKVAEVVGGREGKQPDEVAEILWVKPEEIVSGLKRYRADSRLVKNLQECFVHLKLRPDGFSQQTEGE